VLQEVSDSFAEHKPYESEYRLVHANGEERWVSDRGQPVFDEAGNPAYLDGTVFDITERKQADEKLHFRLDLEKVMGEIPNYFATESDINDAINASLQELGELVLSDRASLWQKSSDNIFFSMTHECCAEGVEPHIQTGQNWSRLEFEKSGLQYFFDTGVAIHISHINQLSPEQNQIRQFFESKNISTIAAIPVMERNKLVAFFTLNEPQRLNEQKNFDVEQLKVFGESFNNALQRRKAENSLVAAKEEAELFLTIAKFVFCQPTFNNNT